MTDKNERMDVVFMGIKLGTASGWDEVDTNIINFYDFVPVPLATNFMNLTGSLAIDAGKGTASIYKEEPDEEPVCTLEKEEFLQMLLDIAKAGE